MRCGGLPHAGLRCAELLRAGHATQLGCGLLPRGRHARGSSWLLRLPASARREVVIALSQAAGLGSFSSSGSGPTASTASHQSSNPQAPGLVVAPGAASAAAGAGGVAAGAEGAGASSGAASAPLPLLPQQQPVKVLRAARAASPVMATSPFQAMVAAQEAAASKDGS